MIKAPFSELKVGDVIFEWGEPETKIKVVKVHSVLKHVVLRKEHPLVIKAFSESLYNKKKFCRYEDRNVQ